MQKKRKSQKTKQKEAIRTDSPWSSQSEQEYQEKSEESEFSVDPSEVKGLFGEVQDLMQGLGNFMKNPEFFQFDKPIIEVHAESKISNLSPTSVMNNANIIAGVIATRKDVEETLEVTCEGIDFSEFGLKIDDLDRIVIHEGNSRTVELRFSEDTENQRILPVPVEVLSERFRQIDAEFMISYFLALFMYIEGKANPENSIQQRTFLFDEATITVNKKMFMHIKDYLKRKGEASEESNLDTTLFEAFVTICGGKVTSEKLSEFDRDIITMLHIAIAFALAEGVTQWPFETAK